MYVEELLDSKLFQPNIRAQKKWEAITELAEFLLRENIIDSLDIFINDVRAREKQVSTGVGSGIAIPHAISKSVKKPAIVFGRSVLGIDYDSIDSQPVDLVFLFAIPDTYDNKDYLRTLASIARLLVHEGVREKLRKASSFKAVQDALR